MKKNILFGFFVFIFASLASHANAAIVKSYDFNGDLSDTLGNGVNLVSNGGTVNSGRYTFTNNQGLRLDSALPNTTDYGIEIKFQLSDVLDRYNKVIDFRSLASDAGLYVYYNKIKFFAAGPTGGVGAVTLNNDFTLGLSRSSGIIELFLDNVSLFSVADNGQAVSVLNILNFFEDDGATGKSESFAGSVDFIRIHDDASTFGTQLSVVPLPAALPMFFSGLVGIGIVGRRRRKRQAA